VLPFNVSVELTCRLRLGIRPRPRSADASCAGQPATIAMGTRKLERGPLARCVHKTAERFGEADHLRLQRITKLLTGRAIAQMKKQPNPIGKPRSHGTKKRRPNSADIQVGASIRAHRLLAGMSQGELGRKIGVTFQQVQKYEKGTNRVGAGRLPQIAEIFGVPVGALFKDHAGAVSVPVKLVTDTATVRLLTAYAEITDRSVRRHLSELVERIADAAKKKMRR
jgi:transcriptional regulator with XRE-family HTH domain